MIKQITGNFFTTDAQVKVHQVNCKGKTEKGLSEQIYEQYPESYHIYKNLCKSDRHGNNMGTVHINKISQDTYLCHLFAQEDYGPNTRQTDYTAFNKGLTHLKNYMKKHNLTTCLLPKFIGCEDGRGDWKTIYGIIKSQFKNDEITCYVLS